MNININIDKIVYSIFDTSNKFICYAEIVNIKDNNYFVINEENKNKLNTISEINISIDTDYNFNYYSINNTPPNDKKWKKSLKNCIHCPIRENVSNYDPSLKYIIHLRNPLDILNI